MSMSLTEIFSGAISFMQSNKAAKIQEQHLEEQRQLQRKNIETLEQMRQQIATQTMQPMQAQSLQPIQPIQPIYVMQTPGQTLQPLQVQSAPVQPTPQPEPIAPAQPYSNYLKEYGQQSREDVSIGCIPCTRAHLSTTQAALQKAEQGDTDALASAREEMAALIEYDLTPEKLAATPERERKVLAKYAERIDSLRKELTGPVPDITTASASLKEAMRFARRGDEVTHPEVQERLARAEDLVNGLERISFSPERLSKLPAKERKRVKEVLPQLREVRQDLINNVHNADDLEAVTIRLTEIDKQLNPAPDKQQLHKAAEQAKTLNTEFRRDVLEAWKKAGEA